MNKTGDAKIAAFNDTQKESLLDLAPVTAFVGHAGVGKTNLVLNLALREARAGKHVAVADMDLVNPYFRSSDYPDLLKDANVRLIAPTFARTALDTPSLGGELDVALDLLASQSNRNQPHADAQSAPLDHLIIDVGGDDIGAAGLGRYAHKLQAADVRLYYVVNAYRNLTQTPEEAAAMLPEIEHSCHLQARGIVNTSNLMNQTTSANVEHGRTFAARVAQLTGLPLVATAIPAVAVAAQKGTALHDETVTIDTAHEVGGGEELLIMERFVVTPWG